MTTQHSNAPQLVFFRQTPEDLMSRPPLASSFQSLETSFLLIALWRFPHALISCASALESALKAGFNCDENDECSFKNLLQQAQKRLPPVNNVDWNAVKEFREKRNTIIHYGFKTEDNEQAALLLLKSGIPLIECCYQHFFNFPLKGHDGKSGGLITELGCHLHVAQETYLRARDLSAVNLAYCFRSFAHQIRWGISHWMLSDWQIDTLWNDESFSKSWDLKQKQKRVFESGAVNPWTFSCPACGEPDALITDLDAMTLEQGEIRLKRGACINCGLVVPEGCPFLLDELCKEEIKEEKPKILKDCGIELPP